MLMPPKLASWCQGSLWCASWGTGQRKAVLARRQLPIMTFTREKLMFTASRLALAVGFVVAGGLTMAAGGDDSRPNPAAIPLERDNAWHRQLLKLVARG